MHTFSTAGLQGSATANTPPTSRWQQRELYALKALQNYKSGGAHKESTMQSNDFIFKNPVSETICLSQASF